MVRPRHHAVCCSFNSSFFYFGVRTSRQWIDRFALTQGSKASSQHLESFARNLCEAFVNGELCVGDWTPDEGAKINVNLVLTLGLGYSFCIR